MARLSFNRNFNIGKVVQKVVYVVLALYVGGTILTTFGNVLNCTESVFYEGLTLIGWTVSDDVNTSAICTGLASNPADNVITLTTGSGVLAVVGIIAIASVIMEFVNYR